MRGIAVDRWMQPGELRVSDLPEPEVRPGTLSVEVRAAGCNFFDILMVQGNYQVKPPFPFVPGAEIGGVVREVGEGVTGFSPGDRVMASSGLGGFAERAVVPALGNYALPEGMSFEEARELLKKQVRAAVRWEDSVRSAGEKDIDVFIEVGPGKVLSGLNKRISRDIAVFNVEDGESLEKTLSKITEFV